MTDYMVAVFAGTPVDTEMGIDCLKAQGISAKGYPVSVNPVEQTIFQNEKPEAKYKWIKGMVEEAIEDGCTKVFVYCNSLSGAVDFKQIQKELSIQCVTPFDAYISMARGYRRLAAITANASGHTGVEKAILDVDPNLSIFGMGMLALVLDIEKGIDPEVLVSAYRLPELCDWFRGVGCEGLILGCTHFPYLKAALKERTDFPVLDPADEMVRILQEG